MGEENRTVEAGDMSNSKRRKDEDSDANIMRKEVGKFPTSISCTSCHGVMSSLPY